MSEPTMRLIRTKDKTEKHVKHPKVPTMPAAAQATAQKLREIIDAGGERATLAYACLSRLCVTWSKDTLTPENFEVVFNQMIGLMSQIFPGGEGLPNVETGEAP